MRGSPVESYRKTKTDAEDRQTPKGFQAIQLPDTKVILNKKGRK